MLKCSKIGSSCVKTCSFFMNGGIKLTAKETLEMINKQWNNVNDIRQLAKCSKKRLMK